MPVTRRKTKTAVVAATTTSNEPAASARASSTAPTRRSTRKTSRVPTKDVVLTDSDSDHDEPVEQPKPKRRRQKELEQPAVARASSSTAPVADDKDENGPARRVTRSAARAKRTTPAPAVAEDVDMGEPEAASSKGKGKAKATPAKVLGPIPADWVPHAIDEPIPDSDDEADHADAAHLASAMAESQQYHASSSSQGASQQQRLADVDDGADDEDHEEVPEEATSWWHFYPDFLDTSLGQERNGLNPVADNDDALLAAAVNDGMRRVRGHEFNEALPRAGAGAAVGANADGAELRPMVQHDDEEEDEDNAKAQVRPGWQRNENELFLCSDSVRIMTRLPMPPETIDMATFQCIEPVIVASVQPRISVSMYVCRPVILPTQHFSYWWGIETENVIYTHPNLMAMTDDEIQALTVADFAEIEARDPYTERLKRVLPSEGRETWERVNDEGFAVPKTPIERSLQPSLMLKLDQDAVARHDGDWPEDPDANFHQMSYAAGRHLDVKSSGSCLCDWTPEHAKYYHVVLRTIKGQEYAPPDNAPDAGFLARQPGYSYVCDIYLRVKEANEAFRAGTKIPQVNEFFNRLLYRVGYRFNAVPPALYVPDTLECNQGEAPTPAGFQLTLRDFQQRTLAWLLSLERSRRSRTIQAHQVTETATKEQEEEFMRCELTGRPRWLQLGPGGLFVNTATFEAAADPAARERGWAADTLPMGPLECRGALEVSKMGSGKTIMALSLVAANPFKSVRGIVWDNSQDKDRYLISRATLVVVRSDLVSQWVAEAQKALPPGAKIVQLATIRDYREVSWDDVLLADVVIVSLSFLQNKNYQDRVTKVAKTSGRYCLPLDVYKMHADQDMWPDRYRRWKQWSQETLSGAARAVNDRIDSYIAELRERGRARFGPEKNKVILERVYWHRLVIDECHELSHVMGARSHHVNYNLRVAETLLFSLKTRFRLGLTGTPPINHVANVVALAEVVGVRNLPTTAVDAQAFLNSHVRRNNPELEVPPVHYRTNWVNLTPAEVGLMASHQLHSVRSRLMMCNHHQINDLVTAITGTTATSVDEVAARVQTARQDKMMSLVARGRRTQNELASLVVRMEDLIELVPADQLADLPVTIGLTITNDDRIEVAGQDVRERLVRYVTIPNDGAGNGEDVMDEPVELPEAVDLSRVKNLTADARATARRIVALCGDLIEIQEQLRHVTAQFRFMSTVLDAIRDAEDQACPVCMEDINPVDPIVITKCAHVYCDACAQILLAQPRRMCAMCRGELDGPGATTRMMIERKRNQEGDGDQAMDGDAQDGDDEDEEEDEDGVDLAKYGSKIKALVYFVRRVLREDPTAKLILFSQFHLLTALMSQAFSEFGIGNVKLMGGNVITKRRAVTLFRNDPDMKILFLSAEDSVSGLQLTEANHVVIVHPFLGASEAMARAYELQGIARAVRAGQKREVTITRFVTRGTIEEELTARRSDVAQPGQAEQAEQQAEQQQQGENAAVAAQ
ncbi:hypothetical protein GGF31_003138 [Allomyces arbusculus]|nr:hypothetical protein GGF31_003138 [Allomyces arbusculus]